MSHTPAVIPVHELPNRVGQLLGRSPAIVVDQARIDAFAQATGDLQWIHCDPERAAQGPFGSTIAHGFLTLSLISWMGENAFEVQGQRMGINYGLNKVRFTAPVPVDSRLVGEFRLKTCEPIEGGWQLCSEVTILREGAERPVCVAESLARFFV